MINTGSGKLADKNPLGLEINPPVFWTSAIIVIGFLVFGLINIKAVGTLFNTARLWVCEYTGWFFVIVVNVILFYMIFLFFSKYGKLKIGGPDSQPRCSLFVWFCMLFSAGTGIGIVFFGVAEPIYHYITPPPLGVAAETIAAAKLSMAITFFHWGFHAWALYAFLGLGLGFFAFSRGLPLAISSVFYPLIGKKIYGPIGIAIDIFASVATLFGLATSQGLAVSQINAGLNYILGIPISTTVQIILIGIITVCVTVSVVGGVYSGIKQLSIITIVLSIFLMAFTFLAGPTLVILNAIPQNIGNFFNQFWNIALFSEAFSQIPRQNCWTIFYWAWWITWAPVVGMFIARISRGRTVKEFITGVLFAPTLLTFLWLTIFGSSALYMEMFKDVEIAQAIDKDISIAIYTFFENLRLSGISSITVIVLAALFFITSSNSATLVITIITGGGKTNPPTIQRVFWAGLQGGVAAALLLGGGLIALQSATLVAGLPLTGILLAMLFSLKKGLDEEYDSVYG